MAVLSTDHEPVTLRDGREVVIGRITPADAPLLAAAFERLSEDSRRLRFLAPKPTLNAAELRYLTDVDGHDHEALVAIDPATGRGVAIARFVRSRDEPARAELAVTVADEWQRNGLGEIMLSRLATRALEEGIRTFTALVSAENHGMQALVGRTGSGATVHRAEHGVFVYELDLAVAARYVAAARDRPES